MTELSTPQIVDSGIDYLRLTVKPGESLSGVLDVWQKLYKDAKGHGHEVEDFRWKWYRGTTCGGYKILGREHDMLFEAQGAVANNAFAAMKGVEFHGNVPRLDAHATIEGEESEVPRPRELLETLQRMQEDSPAFAQVNLEFRKPAKTGHTVYVGARDSCNFARYYDAGAVHSERYNPGARRWELEMKGESARDAYKVFSNAASVPCCATSLVMGRLMSWGIKQSWFSSDPPIKPFSGYKKTTTEGWLDHVDKCFARRFIKAIQDGYGPELCDILQVKSLELRDDLHQNRSLAPLARRLTARGLE